LHLITENLNPSHKQKSLFLANNQPPAFALKLESTTFCCPSKKFVKPSEQCRNQKLWKLWIKKPFTHPDLQYKNVTNPKKTARETERAGKQIGETAAHLKGNDKQQRDVKQDLDRQ
jgi:hypothetical protein